jgi:hypothetical protein
LRGDVKAGDSVSVIKLAESEELRFETHRPEPKEEAGV